MTYLVTIAKSLANDGMCDREHHADCYGSRNKVIVTANLKITLNKHRTRVDLNNNQIYLASGTVCELGEEICIDDNKGYFFWNPIGDLRTSSANI